MKKSASNIWEIFYPIVLYYLVSSLAFFGMTILFGESDEIYMLKQMVSSGMTIPFLLNLKKQDAYAEEVVYGKGEKLSVKQAILLGTLSFLSLAAFGVALNDFIAMTPLVEISTGFQNVNQAFFGGGVLLEILASCVVVPIAEELLFRSVVLKRSSLLLGERLGIVFSALLFGVIHMNLVQFLYATLLGAMLAVFAVKTKRVWLAVLGHAAANLMAILRAETGVLDFAYEADAAGIIFSIAMLAIGILAAGFCFKQYERMAQPANKQK